MKYVGRWKSLPYNTRIKQVYPTLDCLWGISTDNTLCSLCDHTWYRWREKLRHISMSNCGKCWAIDGEGNVQYRHMKQNKRWKKIQTNQSMVYAAVACNGDVAFFINENEELYKCSRNKYQWDYISNSIKKIAVSNDCNHMWAINNDDKTIYSKNQGDDWEYVGGNLKEITMCDEGVHIWGLNTDNQALYRHGFNGSWIEIGGELVSITVAHNGTQVWGADKYGRLWTCTSPMVKKS